jgi:hypothetical protein
MQPFGETAGLSQALLLRRNKGRRLIAGCRRNADGRRLMVGHLLPSIVAPTST